MHTRQSRLKPFIPTLAVALAALLCPKSNAAPGRLTQSLNGEWQIAEGRLDSLPARYDHTIPVPGLADMAIPPFESPGSAVASENRKNSKLRPADPRREAFYYRRTFRLKGPLPVVALLKVNKAKYGARVYVNGQAVGEHSPNFTPGWFNVRPQLKANGAENELVIRIGASLAQVPPYLTEGWDFEKSRYLPGIYDSVELVLSGTPHIVNVQTVPQVPEKSVRVVIELANAGNEAAKVSPTCIVREVKSGKVVGKTTAEPMTIATGQPATADVTIAIPNACLWTPEDPFLYELEVDTGADRSVTRFGMRSFRFDPKTGRAMLNGKTYFLRGSNVCIYRFFEDADRGALPWDENWVRNLHRKFKEMHWNSLRYCIGFPPEKWYEIADEEGVLIQDEFPIWYGGAKDGWPQAITVDHLVGEYTEWMRERWNHPCVVIWDAQNETTDDRVIGAAIQKVRGLDFSQRPWDNGWGTPQQPGDVSEAHPYRSSRPNFQFSNFAKEDGVPNNGPRQGARPPYLINEYGWLWINRDGTLPTLTTNVYLREVGPDATVEQRRHYYARMLAAKTEFWRSRRQCAGVLHFCGLGYSRHDGQTSDNFVDVKNLVYEPEFFKYVRDAFAPVGVALDWWETQMEPGARTRVPVQIINDLESGWQGEILLQLVRDGKVLSAQTKPMTAPAWETGRAEFDLNFPSDPGHYDLLAEIRGVDGQPVRSLRTVRLEKSPENRALKGAAKASTECRNAQGHFQAALAVDGNPATYWSSVFEDHQWLQVDLKTPETIRHIRIQWQNAFARSFAVQVSTDGTTWKDVYSTENGKGGITEITFEPVPASSVRVSCLKRGTKWGHAICELQVFPAGSDASAPPTSARRTPRPAFWDPNLPMDRRVEDLLRQLTLEEKVGLCHGSFVSGGVERLGIGQLKMLDGRQGVRPMDKGVTLTTSLPCALALSCTWDEAAAREFGGLLAEEMLALDQHVLLAPMINLVRSPLGGRNFEKFGEDPYLAGRMTVAYIEGVQKWNVGACSCLVVANDYEGRRHFTSSNLDDRTLREVHLLPTEMSVRDGRVWSMMSANSLLNGVHCAHHRRLLQEIVKDEIGFDGVMITDWRAAYEPVAAALAGTDMTTGYCGYVFGDGRFLEAVKTGKIPAALLDEKVRRILRLYFRCGMLDPGSRPKGGLDTPQHRALARRLGAEGMVLLKNEKQLLPLNTAKLKRILLTGPGTQIVQQGGGSGKVPAAFEITPLEGLKSALPATCELIHLRWDEAPAGTLAKGNVEWTQPANTKGKAAKKAAPRVVKPEIPELRAAAQTADVVIFIAAANRFSEGMDLREMELPDGQNEAIDALARANPNMAVVLVTAGAVNLEPWVARVPAILAAWYAGQSTGDAIADVLTGKVNPAGKLSFTFGRQLNEYPVHALNEWTARLILDKDPGNPGYKPEERKAIHAFDGDYKEGVFVGYRWFDEKKTKPQFPFGHGLSYTKFALSQLAVDSSGDAIRVACTVKNTGDRAGAEVVQVYVAPPKSSVPRPPRELKGFAKVSLNPGENRQVEIQLRPSALAFYDVTTGKWKAERGDYQLQVGVSSRDIRLQSKVRLDTDHWLDRY